MTRTKAPPLALAALLSLALPALAEGPAPLRQAQISAELYARGLATSDPLLILTAASLRKSLALSGATPLPLDWQAMLSAAESLAATDPILLAAIADLRADTPKGVASGPVYRLAALGPGAETEITDLTFRGGTYAEVYIEAATANLDLTIRDASGNLVCADTDPSPIAYCGWTPAADGVFLLTIMNRGPAETDYALMTN
ncbi:hypothetical protein LHP98_15840 [Rhodobacter sp. Har01]|uniref:hypothetical protein n=1 Tax=Rhodobacter sp. Har01 TaxID=2883999 RepID=UPI001D0706DA|nr:hypothetical protein [Rhodobacter sp. Har01]MCB6179594.1 hypothetical protein [Rhodobacter sp. Har01]